MRKGLNVCSIKGRRRTPFELDKKFVILKSAYDPADTGEARKESSTANAKIEPVESSGNAPYAKKRTNQGGTAIKIAPANLLERF